MVLGAALGLGVLSWALWPSAVRVYQIYVLRASLSESGGDAALSRLPAMWEPDDAVPARNVSIGYAEFTLPEPSTWSLRTRPAVVFKRDTTTVVFLGAFRSTSLDAIPDEWFRLAGVSPPRDEAVAATEGRTWLH